MSGYREEWRKIRWMLFVVGVLFAGVITRFWSLAFFQSGQWLGAIRTFFLTVSDYAFCTVMLE
ncbi:MAG TPA: hypothetical protein VJN21_02780 [Candidatus Acidoferrales bacterium]|nr:hypothetical protein [Candidatus Acidoferrales bacterium]